MKVALCQFAISIRTPRENIAKGLDFAARAAADGAALVLLPEMWSTGLHPGLPDVPEVDATPEILAELARIAERTGATIAAGSLPERRADGVYNSARVASPAGLQAPVYRKIHLFKTGREDAYTRPGDALATFDTPLGPAAAFICFDLRFPELFRAAAFAGCRAFLHPTEWPLSRTGHLQALLRARAIENLAFVLSANLCGNDGLLDFAGRSTVVDPWGEVLLEAGRDEGVFTCEVDPEKAVAVRAKFPFLKEAVYGDRLAGLVG